MSDVTSLKNDPTLDADRPSPKRRRKRRAYLPRFGLRSLLLIAVVFCLFFAWIGRNCYRIRQEEASIETLKRAGATIRVKTEGGEKPHPATPPQFGDEAAHEDALPTMLSRALGIAGPYPVSHVDLLSESDDPPKKDVLAALAIFPEIESLRWWSPAFDDHSLIAIAHLPNLERLEIGRSSVSGEGLATLSESRSLKHLILSQVDAKSTIVAGLPALRQLESLHLFDQDLSRDDIAFAASLPKLESLSVSSVNLEEGDVFASLAGAESIREFRFLLDPVSRPLTEADAKSMARLPQVRILELAQFDTALLEPFLSIDSLRILRLNGARDDLAAGRAFSAKRPDCLVECAGTYYLAGQEIEREAAEKLVHAIEDSDSL